jgi:DNA-binding MarR family transcriptional regulator/alkylated DNA nucleotide flippase Atl1
VKAPTAQLARSFAAALIEFANQLESDEEVLIVGTEGVEEPVDQVSGFRQKQILSLDGLRNEQGLKTGEIATAIGYTEPNTYMTLRVLLEANLVERVPGAEPQRWRLAVRYRASASPYLRIAGLVRAGEWTTYGDVSIAVRGDVKGARAVGAAAANLPHFPNPHRILREGGVIPDGWRTTDGQHGPEECRRRLQADGVTFDDAGRASPAQRVQWDTLVSRADELGEPGE